MCAQTPAQLEADWPPRPSITEKRRVGIATIKRAGVRECMSSSLGNWLQGNAHKTPTIEMWSVFCEVNQIVLAAVLCI